MKLAIFATAALLASTTFSLAASFPEDIVAQLEGLGFTVTEVQNSDGTIKFEATRDGKMRELVFDSQTRLLLKDEYDGHDVVSDSHGENEDLDDDSSDDDSSDDS